MANAKVRRVKPYSGYSPSTPDNMLLDAGVFFKNFEVGTDSYASAKAAGKCLGVTIKGGEFSAKPSLRRIEFDGVHTRTIGDTLIDGWEVYIKATLAEMTEENIIHALGVANVDKETDEEYIKITGRDTVLESDYIQNITWIGCILGEDKPCIIQIYNGLNENGLTLSVADKDNGKLEVQFYGNNDPSIYDDDKEIIPPFAIYRPKKQVTTNKEEEQNA